MGLNTAFEEKANLGMLFPSFIKAIMKSCFPDLSGQEPACALLTPGLDYCA